MKNPNKQGPGCATFCGRFCGISQSHLLCQNVNEAVISRYFVVEKKQIKKTKLLQQSPNFLGRFLENLINVDRQIL